MRNFSSRIRYIDTVGDIAWRDLFNNTNNTIHNIQMPLNRTSSIRDYVSELFEHSEFSNTVLHNIVYLYRLHIFSNMNAAQVGEFIRRLHGSSGAGENGSEVSFWMDQTGAVYIRNGERDESLSTIPFPRYVFDNKVSRHARLLCLPFEHKLWTFMRYIYVFM